MQDLLDSQCQSYLPETHFVRDFFKKGFSALAL